VDEQGPLLDAIEAQVGDRLTDARVVLVGVVVEHDERSWPQRRSPRAHLGDGLLSIV
jgi:hypothetical protein